MSESEAVVTRVDGDYVWLDMNSRSGCSDCEKAAGCGLGDGKGKPLQRMRNVIGARVGDTVSIVIPAGAVLKAAICSYLMPLSFALIGAVGGTALGGDGPAVVGAMAGLVAGWLVLRQLGGLYASLREPLLTMRIKSLVVHHLDRNHTL
jgi:sigma-E factor negative regulatory protein RseC